MLKLLKISTEGHLDTGPTSLRESAFSEVSPKQNRGRMEDLETKMHCGRLRLGKSAAEGQETPVAISRAVQPPFSVISRVTKGQGSSRMSGCEQGLAGPP